MTSRDRPGGPPRFYRAGRSSPMRQLAWRAGAVLGLIGLAIIGHWLDRDGLRDNIDGEISFIDVVYFTMITVTTVGYGDIVPVTERARLFDTFVVTPIRIFVWLLFLGTAYSFAVRKGYERWRMTLIQNALRDHAIVCGYGATGAAAVAELVHRGCPARKIVVVDCDERALEAAAATGAATVHGDATHNAVLKAARIERARSLIIAASSDATTVLIALSGRRLAPSVSISAMIRAEENEVLAREAGADVIVNPVRFGGLLLAGSTTGRHIPDYIADLVTSGGRVALHERPVTLDEAGGPLSGITTGLGVRVYRDGRPIGYWEDEAQALAVGDTIVEIVHGAAEL